MESASVAGVLNEVWKVWFADDSPVRGFVAGEDFFFLVFFFGLPAEFAGRFCFSVFAIVSVSVLVLNFFLVILISVSCS